MRKEVVTAILMLALGAGGSAVANAQAKTDQKITFAAVYDHTLSGVEKEFTSGAEAMPEDKFNFAPTQGEFKGVRTFAQQVKHVSAVNYLLGSALMGEKPPVDIGSENGPDSMTSKPDIIKFMHKALATLNESNLLVQIQSPFGSNKITRLALTNIALGHPFDHYGQMAVYLRMNGIVPPASRQ
jgi:hypothetical protein